MTKLERVQAALTRQPTDRPPYAFWRHFPEVDRSPAALAQATLRFHERYGSDFLKVTPTGGYAVQDWGCVESDEVMADGHRPCARCAVQSGDDWRKITPLDTARATAVRTIVLGQGMINGKLMDMNRIDVSTTVGATEIWEIENVVGMDHPFHLHGFQFQVLDRDGVREPYLAWKDMLNIPKHSTARIIVRYDDYPGKWMFHCHILDHEDHGMMGVLEVK